MANATKAKKYVSENERNSRIRNRVYMTLPLVFIAISIAAVLYVLFSNGDTTYNSLFIYLSTGLMDAAMFLIAWESLCWVFTNDSNGRKVGIFFCGLLFAAGTVYAWIHWNKMANLTTELDALQSAIRMTAKSKAEFEAANARIDELNAQRLNLNLNVIILQVVRLFALCGCLLISWTGSKKQFAEEESA